MLLNLHVLDLMEVSGSQMRAARSLSMHQTTVSRSYWELAEQFRKNIDPYIAAGWSQVDDVIDPAGSRARVAAALRASPPPQVRSGRKRPCIDAW